MEKINDGTVSWIGGMDTSRSPIDLAQMQYSRACNVMIPRSLGGIRVRDGLHYQYIEFDSKDTKDLFETGHIQAEGWFTTHRVHYLVVVVNGVVIRLKPLTDSSFYAEALNRNDPNTITDKHWVIRLPYGCIVNNGVDRPLFVTHDSIRRTNPDQNELPPGRMGVYVQDRLFMSNETGTLIYASDFDNPLSLEESRLAGISGFPVPEYSDSITAIGRQKVMLDYAEGGALIFSTRTSIYSVDVRGAINTWAPLGGRVGKVTQTVEGLNAASSYSFESFGTNMYFRTYQYGLSDLKQSQYQFNNLDAVINGSIEVAYWLDNDTSWMLDKCYSRAVNSRLYTTVAPEQDDDQRVFWNGLVAYHPAAVYSNQETAPRRFESLITGIRPWCISAVKPPGDNDTLFVYSYDGDGINRLYRMVPHADYDINHEGKRVEISGWIETRGYDYGHRFTLKKEYARFYSLRSFQRNLKINIYSRTETLTGWVRYHSTEHKIGKSWKLNDVGAVTPVESRPQTRYQVNTPEPNYSKCSLNGHSFLWVQDRIEFTGPLHLDSFIRAANPVAIEKSVTEEGDTVALSYEVKDDFSYQIYSAEHVIG